MSTRAFASVGVAAAVLMGGLSVQSQTSVSGSNRSGAVDVSSVSRLAGSADAVPDFPPPHESPDVSTRPLPKRDKVVVEPARVWFRDGFKSVQVNVDAGGNNIVGDAANEPSLAIDLTDPNTMVIGWRQFDTVENSFRTSGYAYSHDGGQAWTFPGVLEPGVFSSDPILAADRFGRIYYYGLQPGRGPGEWACYLYRSGDGGVTWPQEVYAFGGDKAWITIDQTTGPGSGHIYLNWSPFFNCCLGNSFARSTDGGATFSNPLRVPNDPFWGTLTVDADGVLYVAGGSNFPNGPFVVATSTSARNETVPVNFESVTEVDLGGFFGFSQGPNPAGLLGQLWIAADHSSGPLHGNLYLLASLVPDSLNDPMDVVFSRSEDGGRTWSVPVRVNDDPLGNDAFQWFGTMSVAPNGRIDVVWNDTRDDPSTTFSELYYSSSSDGGRTWSVSMPVSPPFNHFLGYPQQEKLGDYYHMLSDNGGASLAYAATFNGEQDVYFLRIPADCNENGVEDPQDILAGTSADCNANLMPDECESDIDCNGNGVQDICDLADGTLIDLDGNGFADLCEISMALVPVSATGPHMVAGNEITVLAGQTVALEIRLGNWDFDGDAAPLLRSYLAEIDPVGFVSGIRGSLQLFSPDCMTNDDCQAAVGALSECGGADFPAGTCAAGFVDADRGDFTFAGVGNFPQVALSGSTLRFGGISLVSGVADPGEPTYAGTVVLEVPSDAIGTFTIGFTRNSNLVDSIGALIEPLARIPARIRVTTDPIPLAPKNRYLTIAPSGVGGLEAVRVTLVDLPEPFDTLNGTTLWVAEPRAVSENGGVIDPRDAPTFATFPAATLSCQPFLADWGRLGMVQVYHEYIVPGGVYEVEFTADPGGTASQPQRSEPVSVTMSRWGDLAGLFDEEGGFWTEPDGTVDLVTDILAVLDKFSNRPGAPPKARADLHPALPNQRIDILDVTFALGAFRGEPYPFSPEASPCP